MERLPPKILSFDVFRLDLIRGCLRRDNQEIKLPPKPFQALKYLVENPGRLISKAELIQTIWPDTAVTDDSLVQCLMEVRRALSDDAQQIVKTVPRRGYIFDREVRDNGTTSPMTYTEETASVQVVIEESEEPNEETRSQREEKLNGSPGNSSVASLVNAIKRHKTATVVVSVAVTTAVLAGVLFAKPLLTWFSP